jgi:Leucine-rich repeat (LRR) protein
MKKLAGLFLLAALVSVAQAYLVSSNVETIKAMMKSMPGLVSPFGYEWDASNPDKACCFKGVYCLPYEKNGQACDAVVEPQVIYRLHLDGNVGGSLPANFGDLKNLTQIYFSDTQLVGPLPDSFSKLVNLEEISITHRAKLVRLPDIQYMTKLRELNINGPTVDEPLSASWGNHPTLEYLTLVNAGVPGPIPASWNTWKKLYGMDLSQNKLTGSIPSFYGAKWLRRLELNNNQLSGNLPSPLGQNIEHIDFSENMLTGTIPSTYTFYITWLNKNSLVGPIPDVFAGIDILQFSASHNKLTGTVPQSLVNNDKKNYYLNLSYNDLDLCPAPAKIDFGSLSKCNLLGQAKVPSCECADEWSYCYLDCKA